MLNLFLLIPLMTSIANGLDSSLINGEYLFAPAYRDSVLTNQCHF